ADIAGLADAQLDQPCDPVLDGLASAPIVGEGRAGLERAGLLQQAFLGMHGDRPAAGAPDALGTERASRADRRREPELPATIWARPEVLGGLPGRAGRAGGVEVQ